MTSTPPTTPRQHTQPLHQVHPQGSEAIWFRRKLLEWASDHHRDFAWRRQHHPYAVLVAEMMLHRTRARQVEPVYLRFLATYPNPAALAEADDDAVRALMAPLGLRWRAANFLPLARALMDRHNGNVPCDRENLLALPGVGLYVADAVLVFAFGVPASLVDTNTVRVAGRYFGFPTHAESRRRRDVRAAVAALVDLAQAREANLALLDLAATICLSRDPLCRACPVSVHCSYAAMDRRSGMPSCSTASASYTLRSPELPVTSEEETHE